MQLFIILALLLFGGKSDAQNILSEVKPVLESLGGEEMQQALKSAEEISTVLSAVQTMSSAASVGGFDVGSETFTQGGSSVNFPLSPISNIADKDITYSLSQYIAQN